MRTLEEIFCERHGCSRADFSRKVFWKCLHRHALPVAPFILAVYPSYFEADQELITEIRRAKRMNEVWEEVRQYFVSPKYEGWLRRRASIRLSARRLIELAREYLPPTGSPPPAVPRGEG
jgi:hypothetical protein